MLPPKHRRNWLGWAAGGVLLCLSLCVNRPHAEDAPPKADSASDSFRQKVPARLTKYCADCHSADKKKGELDLARLREFTAAEANLKVWPEVLNRLESKEMPPADAPQPSPAEREQLISAVREFLAAEIRSQAGDPGPVPLRRLSHAEYNNTVRDLTGVDLQTAREFPADGAGGEGFTNAAEALTDISPDLLEKYLQAAKETASHAVFLPDDMRFSPSKTRRDWTNEFVAALRSVYLQYTNEEGRLPLEAYLRATIRHRDEILKGTRDVQTVAAQEKLSPKYLRIVWEALTSREPSFPMVRIRERWAKSDEQGVPELIAEIRNWQGVMWRIVPIGSYRDRHLHRQIANEPTFTKSQTLTRTAAESAAPVTLYLVARTWDDSPDNGFVVWQFPRFERLGQPTLLLKDYSEYGPKFEAQEPAGNSVKSFGLDPKMFGRKSVEKVTDQESLIVKVGTVVQIHLPRMLVKDYNFVVEGTLDGATAGRAIRFQVLTTPPSEKTIWDGVSPIVAEKEDRAVVNLQTGYSQFRQVFPAFVCFPHIVPTDEVVSLKQFHRDDDLLMQLCLDQEQQQKLDHLWAEQRFVSQWPIKENEALPLFIGFVTQDQPAELIKYFEGLREPFQKRADEFRQEVEAAAPKQLQRILDFAARAYRRPLSAAEKQALQQLYQRLHTPETSVEDALRGTLSRILVAPEFLFRLEVAPEGKKSVPIRDTELATRLSYFLWASMPDEELQAVAEGGRLHNPDVLAAQTRRMLKSPKARALGLEFGAQWMHVRDFAELKDKNETLFPNFNAELRKAILEETVLFWQDLFQNDRPLHHLLDADYTYLNETLAQFYEIPNVKGPEWRRVEGVHKSGRGGVLGMASVLAKESGASRTSPILRGNWLVETVLGEKLPRPPANVPKLPEQETGNAGLSMRQIVQRHTQNADCAGCHVRIDPFGFALENYDAIGRWRTKDANGIPVDAKVQLPDGSEFTGMDGLREYLRTKKQAVIERLFCRRLLGYALGRSVIPTDQPLIDEMLVALHRPEAGVASAVLTIVRSSQFQQIRGRDYASDP